MIVYAISWRTRDRRLIHRVCAYLRISPSMSVNRITRIGSLNDTQIQALQPLVDNRSISLLKFKE